ncbi:MAG: HlyD family efflux transporter periplasmic adaptor subunit [Planctomycetota bacterium]
MNNDTTTKRAFGALKPVMVAAGVVLALAGVVAVWGSSLGGGSGRSKASPDVVTVGRGGFDIITTSNGELEAKNQIEIRSKLESVAAITEIVAEGTRVKAGDLLVKLNTDQIQKLVDVSSLELENALSLQKAAEHAYDIQVNENDQKLRQASLKLELAELERLQWLEGEVKTKRQANQLALSKSALEVDRNAEKLTQSYGLIARGFMSKDEFDKDQVAYIEAQSAWITARLQNDVYESYEYKKSQKKYESDVDEARADLDRVRLNNGIQLSSKEAELSAKKRMAQLQDEQHKKHLSQLGSATIKAPGDGLVVYATSMSRFSFGDQPMQIGRDVRPNEMIILLPDTSEMVATVRVPEGLADRIKKGQRSTVKVDAAGGQSYQGQVDSIGVLAEANNWRDPNLKEYTVKIALDKSIQGLKPSMRCDSQILMDRVDDALTVPVQCVFSDGPVRFVYEKRGSKYTRVPVRLGRQSESTAEVLAGVEAGAAVLAREPGASEIIAGPWDTAKLELAGYQVGPDGQPIQARRGPKAVPGAGAQAAKPADPAAPAGEGSPVGEGTPEATPSVTSAGSPTR